MTVQDQAIIIAPAATTVARESVCLTLALLSADAR